MGFLQQTWTLTYKNVLIVLYRHWFTTTLRAFLLPIVYMFFISYAKNFFVPPAHYGFGASTPVRSLTDGLGASGAGRHIVGLVTNGFTDGAIGQVITNISSIVENAGKELKVVDDDTALAELCPSSLRGVTECYAAASFYSSPNQGPSGVWNYTVFADGALAAKVYTTSNSNDVEIYVLPFQRAIDAAIADIEGRKPLPAQSLQYPFTDQTQEQRAQKITRLFQQTLLDIISVAFFIGICGILYQLVGHMALERELGMSQLIEVMMPNRRTWQPQAARLISYHVSFDIIYLPGWIIMGLTVAYLVFPQTNAGVILVTHLLTGFSLASFSLFCGSFFKRSQLSGITTVIISLILAIIAQIPIGINASTGAVIILSLFFPPICYVLFLIHTAGFQQRTTGLNLLKGSPATDWQVPALVFWIIFVIQIFVFPLLAALIETRLYGTSSKSRRVNHQSQDVKIAVRLSNFSKHYKVSSALRKMFCWGRRRYQDTVVAVEDLSLEVLQGQICVMLGANGSGKSTTLDAIAGLNTITQGTIDVDGTGGLGLCPQKNVLWDELTVFEHVTLFNRLKTIDRKATKTESKALVASCDLSIKLNAKAATLSGGQKRKLQLAMMFTGGSKVCCADEVSSGIDPLARRKIWDILLAERGKRTILLTTHFLDEADVLSDHIAMLSKGSLKAEGTAVELKTNLGGGYRIFIDKKLVKANPGIQHFPHYNDFDRVVFQLSSSSETSTFLSVLEAHSISDFRVQGPTVEDVFLRLADEIRIDLASATELQEIVQEHDDGKERLEYTQQPPSLDLLTGKGTSAYKQSRILFRKRFTVLQRNYLPYLAAVLLPIAAGGLVTLFLHGFGALGCNPADQTSTLALENLTSIITADVPYGPPGAVPTQALFSAVPLLNASSLHPMTSLAQLNNYTHQNYQNVTPGGFFINATPTFNYVLNEGVYPAVLVQSLLDSVMADVVITTGYQPFAIPFAPSAGSTLQFILYFGLAMSAYPAFFSLYPTAERLRKVRALHFSNGIRSGPLWVAYTCFDFLFVLLASTVIIVIFVTRWDGWYYPSYLFVTFFLYGLASIMFSYFISLLAKSQLAAFAFAAGVQCIFFLLYFITYLSIITYAPVNQITNYITIAHFTISIVTPTGNMARALLLTLNEFSLLCRGHSVASYPGAMDVYGGPILYLIVQFFVLMLIIVWWDSGGRLALFSGLFSRNAKSKDSEEACDSEDPEILEELNRVQTNNDGLRVLHLTKTFGKVRAIEDVTFGVQKGETFALLGPNGAGKSTTISLIRSDLLPSTKESEVFVSSISLQKHRAAARNYLGVCPQFDAIDQMTVLEHLQFYARARGVPEISHNVDKVIRAVGLTTYGKRLAARLSGGNKRKLSLAIALMGNPTVLLLDEPSSGMDAAAKRVMWSVLSSINTGRAILITTHSMEEADALADRAGIMAQRMLALGTTQRLRYRHGDALNVHMVHREAPHTSVEDMENMREWVARNIPGVQIEDRTYHGQLRFSVMNIHSSFNGTTEVKTSQYDERSIAKAQEKTVNDEQDVDDIFKTPPTTPAISKPDADKDKVALAHQRKGVGALFDMLEQHKEQLGCSYYSVAPSTLDQVFLNVVNKHNVEEENYNTEHQRESSTSRKMKRARFINKLFHHDAK